MKAVLMSIQPKWCELIASGKKTVEVRKTKPKIETPFKVYIYCTNSKEKLWVLKETEGAFTPEKIASICAAKDVGGTYKANGKVIGEFVCNNIDQYDYDYCPHPEIGMNYDCGDSWWDISDEDLENACLTYEEFKKYAWRYKVMYGWNISNLVIYDKPKELSEFKRACPDNVYSCAMCRHSDYTGMRCTPITRPPQSWCYVESR